MGPEVPIELVEEDEFDWEAAVREIDLACLKSLNPSSSSSSSSTHFTKDNDTKPPPPAKRQSTLDRFIARPDHKPPPPPPLVFECGNNDDSSPSVGIDPETANTWIYPVNVPLRDYQFAITKTALFSNTLVALPTGLGKIVFAAPSRPLVMQQIEACHNIVGIPQEWTIDLTGQTCPSKRASLWKSKRVFFVTPQVLEKDIQSGTCLTNCLVCLVIDEAHRALGNYSYCVVVRELMAVPVQLRILALTATPGSKTQAIQGIIDNLQISTLEYRNESDHDVCPYVHDRKVELIQVPLGKDADEVSKRLLDVIRPYALSPHELLMARDKFREAPVPGIPHISHGDVESCFAALITLYHIRKLLSSHGIRPAYEMLEEKLQEGPFARLMSKNEDIRMTKLLMQQRLSNGAPSPKLSKMLEILVDHYKIKDPRTSRVIIFSNFRGSVRDIMDALSSIGDVVKATEFIGQSSGKTLKGQSQKVQQAVLEIPHVYKPEVQHVKFSIEQFIPRGKKLQDEPVTETPAFKKKLTPEEMDMLAKYFKPDEEKWRVSLIAFPHFQTLPSKVHKVMHSRQTSILIDAMQHLQETTLTEQSKSFFIKDGAPLAERNELDTGLRVGDDPKDLPSFDDLDVNTSQRKAKQVVESPTSTLETTENDFEASSPRHCYLFSSECASVDTLGKVFVLPVPLSFSSNVPGSDYVPLSGREKELSSPNKSHIDVVPVDSSSKHRQDCANENLDSQSLLKRHSTDVGKGDIESCPGEIMISSDEDDCEDLELSPRLTNFIKTGVVPDSPVYDQGVANEAYKEDLDLLKLSSPTRFSNELAEEPSTPEKNVHHKCSDDHITSKASEFRTPQKEEDLANGTECFAVSPMPEDWRTPLANITNASSSASKDWRVSSGEKSETLRQPRKLKRLRRLGDCSSAVKENIRSRSRSEKNIRGKKKIHADNNARIFIDAEAEVSSESEMSVDENEDLTGDSFEDSFIDDGTMPTANTQAECAKVDMMAVYRRSLLSQSPLPARLRDVAAASPSPYSSGLLKTINESRSDSDKPLSSLRTPQTTNNESNKDAMATGDFSVAQISADSRKRKFSLCNSANVPVINLENKFEAHAQATEKESHEGLRSNAGASQYKDDDDDDDAFYATLDFDAIEAQATLLLSKQRSETKTNEDAPVKPHLGNQRTEDLATDGPSFDLGLW
ncbi:hypothetical protein Bca101_055657 [Brassica carinata]